MSDALDTPSKGIAFAHVSFAISVLTALGLLGIMMATTGQSLSYEMGFKTLTLKYGPDAGLIALGISILALLISLFRAPKTFGPWAMASFLVAGSVVGSFYAYTRALKAYPPITEAATNWDRPIDFSKGMLELRGNAAVIIIDDPYVPKSESLKWGGRRVSEINANTCVGAVTIAKKGLNHMDVSRVLSDNDLKIYGRSQWAVEATKKDWFYGFKYDVSVRIDPQTIDIRSVSRQKVPDLGANCRLVTRLVKALKAQRP